MSIQSNFSLGDDLTQEYLPLLKNKTVGLIANPTSKTSANIHIIDYLIEKKVNLKKLFAPEHGLRGASAAGEDVHNGTDPKTGLPVISLYGKERKPSPQDLEGLDILIFDIQDVGTRFYTYISTMKLAMEAAAENNKQFIVFDRPNPNGSYIGGPVITPDLFSFIGICPIPVVHGLTIGELAKMINGELWCENSVKIPDEDLNIIKMHGYKHSMKYSLPIKPSPNLATDLSIQLYPSLGIFEATTISVGRGSTTPFEVIGFPEPKLRINYDFQISTDPSAWPQNGKHAYGESFHITKPVEGFTINPFYRWYWDMRDNGYTPEKIVDRPDRFAMLIGSHKVLESIENKVPYEEIESSWQCDINSYKEIREKYRLYD